MRRIVMFVCAIMFGLMIARGDTPQRPIRLSIGKDQAARKMNTPELFAALQRYVDADRALREEFLSYRSEMDVDYDRLAPLFKEAHDALKEVEGIISRFDEMRARSQLLKEQHKPDAPEG